MLIYVFPLLILMASVFLLELHGKSEAKNRLAIFFFSYIYLTIIIGLRFNIGGDSYFYYLYFDQIDAKEIFDGEYLYQPLFEFIFRIAKGIYPSFVIFQIIHALILNTVLFIFIYRNSINFLFSLLLCLIAFYINFSVEILRESLAVVSFLISYSYMRERKWIIYYTLVFIAILFHLSALILIILPLFKDFKINKKFLLLLSFFMIIMMESNKISVVFGSFNEIYEKIIFYSGVSYTWMTYLLFLMVKGFLPLVILLIGKWHKKINIADEGVLAFGILLGFATAYNPIIFSRFYNYILPIMCIALSDVLVAWYRRGANIYYKLLPSFFSMLLILGFGVYSFFWPVDYYKKWVPYQSIFNEAFDDGAYYEK